MGPAKSKHLSLHHDHDDPEGELGHLRRIESSKEERRRRRKWRKKQGYSLPTGMDMVGRISAASSQPDLPDIDQDDAILVSYSQSNAEKFSHLRPNYQNRSDHRISSSEEPDDVIDIQDEHDDHNDDQDNTIEKKHVHVIRISDNDKPNNCKQCVIFYANSFVFVQVILFIYFFHVKSVAKLANFLA